MSDDQAGEVRRLQARVDLLTAQNAELQAKVRRYQGGNGALMVDADRRERRAAENALSCTEHGKELQYLRHTVSWYWAAMVQQESARQGVVMANQNTAGRMRGHGPDAMVRASDVADWLEKNVDAQNKVLRRPAGYPTLADCLRAGGCEHDGLADGVKAEIAAALQL